MYSLGDTKNVTHKTVNVRPKVKKVKAMDFKYDRFVHSDSPDMMR